MDYIILMQTRIGVDEKATILQITKTCKELHIKTFIPVSRTDDDSRIDCYIFDTKLSPTILFKKWKSVFSGVAILIEKFNNCYEKFFIKKAAEIFVYIYGTQLKDIDEMHLRRHLMHYIFNSLGYNYLNEAIVYTQWAEKFLNAQRVNISK
jgi:hypothetical protein